MESAYERLTERTNRLARLVQLGAPLEIIFHEINILYKRMPDFEEAFTKWSALQVKLQIAQHRNNQGLCSKCPEEIDESNVLGLCVACDEAEQ